MSFEPLQDRVLIEPIDPESKTPGGLIIPDNAKEKSMQGKVVAVGKGAYDSNGNIIPMSLKAGDKVLYGKWGGTDTKIDGKDLVIMQEKDVLGKI